jgi:hypothetical protein
METQSEKPIWQLLLEDPTQLSREECYAVIEYYLDTSADHAVSFEVVKAYLEDCPREVLKEHLDMYRMMARRAQKRQNGSRSRHRTSRAGDAALD